MKNILPKIIIILIIFFAVLAIPQKTMAFLGAGQGAINNEETAESMERMIEQLQERLNTGINPQTGEPYTPEQRENIETQIENIRTQIANLEAESSVAYQEAIDDMKGPGSCSLGLNFSLWACTMELYAFLLTLVIGVVGLVVLYIPGLILDFSINFSIQQLGVILSAPGFVLIWGVIRDLCNVAFIFVLLYIALAIIFELSNVNPQKMIVNVIIVALLINFSGFFTKIVIDSSNVIAYHFYSEISPGDWQTPTSAEGVISSVRAATDKSLAWQLISRLGLTTFWSKSSNLSDPDQPPSNASSLFAIGNQGLLSVVLMITAGIIFIIASFLFIARSIHLIFLFILSPIAFISYALPKYNSYGSKWINELIKNAFFAPAFLAMLWLVFKILDQGTFAYLTGSNTANSSGLISIWDNIAGGTIASSMFFAIVIAMLFYSLKISTSFGVWGANTATKWGKSLGYGAAGLAGAHTIGRGATRLANSKFMQDAASRSRIGRGAVDTLNKVGKSGFNTGTKGFQQREEEGEKKMEERFNGFKGPQASEYRANYISSLKSQTAREALYDKLSADKREALDRELSKTPEGRKLSQELRATLKPKDKKELGGAIANRYKDIDETERADYIKNLDQDQWDSFYRNLNAQERIDMEKVISQISDPAKQTETRAKLDNSRNALIRTNPTIGKEEDKAKKTAQKEERSRQRIEEAGRIFTTEPGAAPLSQEESVKRLRNLTGSDLIEILQNPEYKQQLFQNPDLLASLRTEHLASINTQQNEGVIEFEDREKIKQAIINRYQQEEARVGSTANQSMVLDSQGRPITQAQTSIDPHLKATYEWITSSPSGRLTF